MEEEFSFVGDNYINIILIIITLHVPCVFNRYMIIGLYAYVDYMAVLLFCMNKYLVNVAAEL